jgi:cytochrome c oxidase subunit 4
MSHAHHDSAPALHIHPKDTAKIRRIWMTALILAVVTSIEFILAFTMQRGPFLTSIFVLLRCVKTFYIVGEFMHLKYERKILIWSIILPVMFIIWLITALLMEGGYVFVERAAIFN